MLETANFYEEKGNMEIIRESEIQEIMEMINTKPYGKYLICGPAGCGKTFLLNILGNRLEEQGKKVIYKMARYSRANDKLADNQSDNEKTVCLFDGLDEAYSQKRIIEEIRKKQNCFVCTARENMFDIKFDYIFNLKPLTVEQSLLLINDYIGRMYSDGDVLKGIFDGIDKYAITPRVVIEKIRGILIHKGIGEDFAGFEKDIYQLYTYGKGISLQHPKIIVPERNVIKVPEEVKNDINVITRSLLDKVAIKPEILYEITPRQFEEFVCEMFEREGYNVRLTKQTRDGGKDLIVLNKSLLGDMIIYAECKKYSPKYPVNVGLVRELYGTVEADRATAGIMVTTSYFSKDARKFQEQIKGRMNFLDYKALVNQIMEYR